MKAIGIVLETREDASVQGVADLNALYHWREPDEIEAITEAVEAAGHKAVILGTPETLCRDLSALRSIDFIFNLSVGFSTRWRLSRGPNLYELFKLPYSGADPYTKMASQNKHLMKAFWDKLRIPTPAWTYLHEKDDLRKAAVPPFPLIIKPAHEGSSIGIGPHSVVSNDDQLNAAVGKIFDSLKMPVIAERFIAGREYHVGVIGNIEPEFVGVIEDVMTDESALGDDFLYFGAKKEGRYLKRACDAKDPKFENLLADALRIYRLFCPVDYGTFDVRMDAAGKHYFLEFNADATLHPMRTLAKCCELNGIGFPEMIRKILECSFRRWDL